MNDKVQTMLSRSLLIVLALFFVFSVILVLPVYNKYREMKSGVERLKSEYNRVYEEKQTLAGEVHDLEHKASAAEKVAREKYLLCREGEQLLIYKN